MKFDSKATSVQHRTPADRHPLSFESFEELIAPDDPVRYPDAFAEKIEIPFPIPGIIRIGRGIGKVKRVSTSKAFALMACR